LINEFRLDRIGQKNNLVPMRVAAVQFQPVFGDVEGNIDRALAMIEDIPADLFVMPELCFSGYTFTSGEEARKLAETPSESFTLNRLKEMSRRRKAGIIFGFPEKDGRNLYNSCALVTPSGEAYIYRKLHLYYYEKDWFTPGNLQLKVVNFYGARIGMMICFDWYFPEVCRTLALKGAQLVCHPSNLVMSHCQQSMITRCLENAVFSVTANRVGIEKRGEFDFEFTGQSRIISPRGEVLYSGSKDKEEVGIADIELEKSDNKKVNFKNDLWADRRPDYYRMEPDGEEQPKNPGH
jgi:predicted amidohydrolase